MKPETKFRLHLAYHILFLCVVAPLIGMCLVNDRIYYSIYTEVCLMLSVPYLVNIGFNCKRLMDISFAERDKQSKLVGIVKSIVISMVIIFIILLEFIIISLYIRYS